MLSVRIQHIATLEPRANVRRMPGSNDRVALERNLYLDVLRILSAADPAKPLRDALAGLVEICDAERGYLELYRDASAEQRRWSIFHRCSEADEEEIRAVTSRGIVASAIASGTTVHTAFALLDQRFADFRSVREQKLEAVLCVPLKGQHPGVLYLEGKRGAGPFRPEVVSIAENVAGFIGAAVERAIGRDASAGDDPTRPFRERLRLEGIAGRSKALAYVFEQVALGAPIDITMLITGPSGTGKTQLARAIHDNSKRRNGPFVELNCAAIPEGLIESELFGTMPGAFPGARRSIGKVEAAEGGTLFLDEIAEIPLSAQGKLLQLLQSKQYYALASPRVATANVRVIVATNAEIKDYVAERRFREDLYYRISVLSLRMPSLSERREDVGGLVDHLVAQLAVEHELPRLTPSPGFRAACEVNDWPGNVRQLRHALEAALIRAAAEGATYLEPRHLSERPPPQQDAPVTFHEATHMFQRDFLQRSLNDAGWNIKEVAQQLNLTRAHVYNLISRFKLSRAQT